MSTRQYQNYYYGKLNEIEIEMFYETHQLRHLAYTTHLNMICVILPVAYQNDWMGQEIAVLWSWADYCTTIVNIVLAGYHPLINVKFLQGYSRYFLK